MEYKNILWIDDCDDNDAGNIDEDILEMEEGQRDNMSVIQDYFYELADEVCLIKEYKKALEELKSRNARYDLVVFDINMKEGIDEEDYPEIEETLKQMRVEVTDKDDFKEKAGMYLYIFLLNCGYPNERMIFLTGNGKHNPIEFLKKAHICTDARDGRDFIIEKGGKKASADNKGWINKYYEDAYYQIRRLVYKACEYWKEKIADEKAENIAFNQIYFHKEKEVKIEAAGFINMLDRIELLFPVIKPQKPETVYYHALQVASMFHEESADINKLNNDDRVMLKKYHQSVRNFRNWSAHNKFKENSVDGCLFAYIFCIALRTYFADIDKQFSIEIEVYDIYEKQYFTEEKASRIDAENFKDKYRENWKRHFGKVKENSGKKGKSCLECKDVHELLLASGMCNNKDGNKMELTDTIFNLLKESMKREGELEELEDGFCYRVNYIWSEDALEEKTSAKMDEEKTKFFEEWAVNIFLLS